jgi:hypothetical protein
MAGIPLPIEQDDLMAFLTEKGVSSLCQMCRKSKGWNVGESAAGRGLAVSMLGNDGQPTNVLYPLLPLSCVNCGNMWLINRVGIEAWMRERQAAK